MYFLLGAHLDSRENRLPLTANHLAWVQKGIRLDLSHNPSSFDTIPHMFYCPELMHVRFDVTKWWRAFLLWKKPEEKLSKMADVQIQKTTSGTGFAGTLFVTFERKNSLLLLFTSNLSFSYSFKLHNKI